MKISRYQWAQLSTLRHWLKSTKNWKIGPIVLKLKSRPSFKVYLVKLLTGVAKNWAILQKTHLEACYTPNFHYKRQCDAILIKFCHWNHLKITFIFHVLLVTGLKFDYLAGLQFWLKLGNSYVFGPFWAMSKCAQMSYLIPKTLQNSMQPTTSSNIKKVYVLFRL